MPGTGEHPFATVVMGPSQGSPSSWTETACAKFPEPLIWREFHPYNQSEFDSSQGGPFSAATALNSRQDISKPQLTD